MLVDASKSRGRAYLRALALSMSMASLPLMAAPAAPTIAGFSSHSADLGNGVLLHYWIGGHGQPAVLLHGWPETGYAWRLVAPKLAATGFQLIIPDLRGFGNSSHPMSGYDRLTMAEDVRKLVEERLQLGPVFLIGHDWGGSTAAAWAIAHPDEVRGLVVIEAQPRGPWSKPEPWFYAFHRAAGFPEAMTAGKERTYLSWFYGSAIGPHDIEVYLRTYGSPEGMRPGFELVRSLPRDIEVNTEAAKHPVNVPTLAIGGGNSMGAVVGENLKPLFTHVRETVLPGVGHFVPEEAPDDLLRQITSFCSSQP